MAAALVRGAAAAPAGDHPTRSTAACSTRCGAGFPDDEGRVERVSLIEEGGERKIRMANLAIVGSHSTNGVAAIHSGLLRTVTVKDLAELFPERFSNKTNGVTPRRWLLLANPALAGVITEAIGDGWITDLAELAKLTAARRRPRPSATPCARPSATPRCGFRDWLKSSAGVAVDPDSIFDSQVKRIHEYKRQLLNGLRIVVLYNRLRQNPDARDRAAHLLLRRQGGAGLSPGQADHQVPQQPRRHDRRRPGGARPPQGRFPARILRVAGRAADPRERRVEPDLDRRLRGERHQQHEVHDERRA